MHKLSYLVALTLLAQSSFAEGIPPDRFADSDKEVVYLNQNWSPEESIEFYSIRQGSPLIRKALFDALEQPDSQGLFRESAYLESFGFLKQKQNDANPDGYPIGFVSGAAIELNCSACHTSKLTHGTKEYRIDGGQARTDLETWLAELVRAMQLTLKDAPSLESLRQQLPTTPIPLDQQTKFGRFAKRLTGSTMPRISQVYPIIALLQSDFKRRQKYNDLNDFGDAFYDDAEARSQANKHTRYGYARLDALGAILNQASAEILDIDDNAHAADAPVNYPSIWDAPQHDHVQWNGAVDNQSFLGPLGRNTGQVIGVFGIVDIEGDALIGYESSARFDDLKRAEELITTLWSPKWPFDIHSNLIERGRTVFVESCVACHADMKRDDPNRIANDKKIPIFTAWQGHQPLNTDPLTAERFSERKAKVGPLANRYKELPLGERFPQDADTDVPSREILSHLVLRVVARSFVPWRDELTIDDTGNTGFSFAEAVGVPEQNKFMVYKSRPLNGVWSTAPYLHNGSVLNMVELLKPANQRLKEFKVGTTEYDPDTMGFKDKGEFSFRTETENNIAIPGNSNSGHEYGVGLEVAEKKALLEYLKTL